MAQSNGMLFAVFLDVTSSMSKNSSHLYREDLTKAVRRVADRAALEALAHKADGDEEKSVSVALHMFGGFPDNVTTMLSKGLFLNRHPPNHEEWGKLRNLIPGAPDFFHDAAVDGAAAAVVHPGVTVEECRARSEEFSAVLSRRMSNCTGGWADYPRVFANIATMCSHWMATYSSVVVLLVTDSAFQDDAHTPLAELRAAHPKRISLALALVRPQLEAAVVDSRRALASPLEDLPGVWSYMLTQEFNDVDIQFPEAQGRQFFFLNSQEGATNALSLLLRCPTYHAFLAHAWGANGLFHERLLGLKTLMRSRQRIISWIDQDELNAGDLGMFRRMQEGIRLSDVCLLFITPLYLEKAMSKDDRQYVYLEIKYLGVLVRSGKKPILPIVLDPLSAADLANYNALMLDAFGYDVKFEDLSDPALDEGVRADKIAEHVRRLRGAPAP